MAELRKAHVIRIQNDHSGGGKPLADGTTADQVASDDSVWMDVLRIDQFAQIRPNASAGPPTQTIITILKWRDGPDDQPNTARKLKTIKITNPNDESQWIKLDIVARALIDMPNSHKESNQFVHVFKNTDANTARVTDTVTVYNTDVSQLDMSRPVDWFKDYQPALMNGTQDKTQSVDVEIPKHFLMTMPNAQSGPPTQNFVELMKNKEVEDAINQKPPSL